jgi:hypothetical protein
MTIDRLYTAWEHPGILSGAGRPGPEAAARRFTGTTGRVVARSTGSPLDSAASLPGADSVWTAPWARMAACS